MNEENNSTSRPLHGIVRKCIECEHAFCVDRRSRGSRLFKLCEMTQIDSFGDPKPEIDFEHPACELFVEKVRDQPVQPARQIRECCSQSPTVFEMRPGDWAVHCEHCWEGVGLCKTKEDAIKEWNNEC